MNRWLDSRKCSLKSTRKRFKNWSRSCRLKQGFTSKTKCPPVRNASFTRFKFELSMKKLASWTRSSRNWKANPTLREIPRKLIRLLLRTNKRSTNLVRISDSRTKHSKPKKSTWKRKPLYFCRKIISRKCSSRIWKLSLRIIKSHMTIFWKRSIPVCQIPTTKSIQLSCKNWRKTKRRRWTLCRQK